MDSFNLFIESISAYEKTLRQKYIASGGDCSTHYSICIRDNDNNNDNKRSFTTATVSEKLAKAIIKKSRKLGYPDTMFMRQRPISDWIQVCIDNE